MDNRELLRLLPQRPPELTGDRHQDLRATAADAFRDCPPDILAELLSTGTFVALEAGQGLEPNQIFETAAVTVAGCLALGFADSRGRVQAPLPLFRGLTFGESRFAYPVNAYRNLFGSRHAVAVMDTLIYRFNNDVYQKALEDQGFLMDLNRRSQRMILQLTQLLMLQAMNCKETLLARYLLFLNKYCSEPEGTHRLIAMDQKRLAMLACISKRNMISFIGEWAHQGIISYERGTLIILDEAKLMNLALEKS